MEFKRNIIYESRLKVSSIKIYNITETLFILTANPTLVAIELLQLHDLKAKVQAAAEKQEATVEAIQDAAPTPRQLKGIPIFVSL